MAKLASITKEQFEVLHGMGAPVFWYLGAAPEHTEWNSLVTCDRGLTTQALLDRTANYSSVNYFAIVDSDDE